MEFLDGFELFEEAKLLVDTQEILTGGLGDVVGVCGVLGSLGSFLVNRRWSYSKRG